MRQSSRGSSHDHVDPEKISDLCMTSKGINTMYAFNHSEDDDRLNSLGLSVRAYNYCLRNGIRTVLGLLKYFEQHNQSIPPGINAGRTTINELTDTCKRLISSAGERSDVLEEEDNIKLWGLSTRAYNFCLAQRINSKEDLIKFYLTNGKSIPPGANVGNKTTTELSNLCKTLLKQDPNLANECAKYAQLGNENWLQALFQLNDEDVTFVSNFKDEHNHLPILWLTSKLIDTDEDLTTFCYVYGTDLSKGVKSVSQLSDEMNVSAARVGQRVANGQYEIFHLATSRRFKRGAKARLSDIYCKTNTEYLSNYLDGNDVLCSEGNNLKLRNANQLEHTSFSDAFILKLISSLSDNYICCGDFERNRPNPDIMLISKKASAIFDYKRFRDEFDDIVHSCSEKVVINLRENIEDSRHWHIYSSWQVDQVIKSCKHILLSKYGLYDKADDDIYIITPKKIDLGAIVYSIVSKSGRPLVLSEIRDEILKQYPDSDFSEDNIRLAIREDNRIQFQRDGSGKSKFLLANVDVPSSVRDAIIRTLEKSETPILLDEIFENVILHFPKSSKNSVRTSMLNDSKARFIQFANGRFGLASKSYPEEYEVIVDNSRVTYDERVIALKNFLNEKRRFPSVNSRSAEEVSLARWLDRNKDRFEASALIEKFEPIIWAEMCQKCENFIITHSGQLPSDDRQPELYKWILKAADDYNCSRLNQAQRKLYLHLTMVIRNRHA